MEFRPKVPPAATAAKVPTDDSEMEQTSGAAGSGADPKK
jgi:hypothetical protein